MWREGGRGAYGAVGQRDGAGELDHVAWRDRRVLLQEVDEVVNAVADAVVGLEERLDGREDEHRAVGAATAVGQSATEVQMEGNGCVRGGAHLLRDGDGVVEGETDDLVGWKRVSCSA